MKTNIKICCRNLKELEFIEKLFGKIVYTDHQDTIYYIIDHELTYCTINCVACKFIRGSCNKSVYPVYEAKYFIRELKLKRILK
jgi:hypothetical protein